MAVGRRAFLSRAMRWPSALALASAATRLGPAMSALAACEAGPRDANDGDGAYGQLEQAGAHLFLPAGFSYAVLATEGQPMSDGRPTPRAADGMAAFPAGPGRVRLVRNHEVNELAATARPLGDPARGYDGRAGGGTTTLEVEIAADGAPRLVRDRVSLSGTLTNCGGGPTPWGSWLSCEETVDGPAQGYEQPHGYVFEVPSGADAEVPAVPLRALGRFVHEAAAVDPRTGNVYLTEDQGAAGFYRFVPAVPGVLSAGGRLEMLGIDGRPGINLGGFGFPETLPVRWMDVDEPDPRATASGFVANDAVFQQGLRRGGALFVRPEGCIAGTNAIYFTSTSGGYAQLGQVWEYRLPDGPLHLLYESGSRVSLEAPDNVTVSPRGGILLCEDGPAENYLRGLTSDGRIFDFARNTKDQEFAGATFSPDGRVLFVNMQGDRAPGGPGNLSYTFAIWGPWERGAL